jgi:hypothetical protein
MTIHELITQLRVLPDVELPNSSVINLTLYQSLEDYAGIGTPHRMLSWVDDHGYPRSITW